MLRRRVATLWLWQALFVLAIIGGFVSHHFTVQEMMARMRFVAMDSRDTWYLTSGAGFETAQHLHAEAAKLAVNAIFSRNPDGYDQNEVIERLFNPATAAQLAKDAARDADVFRVQQIHSKCEVGQIRELEVDNNTALVSVEAQVLRTGVFNNRVTNDAKKVTVFLRLAVNNDIARNGRFPMVVTNMEERFE